MLIQQAMLALPAGSEMHRDATQAVQRLSRHIAQGQPTAGAQQTGAGDLMRAIIQNALAQRVQQNQGGRPPMPTTPSLPGA
jgi:hypothetical protein